MKYHFNKTVLFKIELHLSVIAFINKMFLLIKKEIYFICLRLVWDKDTAMGIWTCQLLLILYKCDGNLSKDVSRPWLLIALICLHKNISRTTAIRTGTISAIKRTLKEFKWKDCRFRYVFEITEMKCFVLSLHFLKHST